MQEAKKKKQPLRKDLPLKPQQEPEPLVKKEAKEAEEEILEQNEDEFSQLQKLIQEKREFLRKRQQKINRLSKNNQFLSSVKKDYSKYHDFIVQQETEKMGALTTLRDYVRDLNKSVSMSNDTMQSFQNDETRIINEVDNIKKNIDGIIGQNQSTLNNAKAKAKVKQNLV